MKTPHLLDAILGDLAEPEAEGECRAGEVILEPAHGLQLGFLDHVGGVHPGPELGVQPQLDEPLQIRALPAEELVEGHAITRADLLQQAEDLWRVRLVAGHDALQMTY